MSEFIRQVGPYAGAIAFALAVGGIFASGDRDATPENKGALALAYSVVPAVLFVIAVAVS